MTTSFPTICLQCLLNISRHIDTKICASGQHSSQVAHWVKMTAQDLRMGEDSVQTLFWAAQLHDVGKIGIPESILMKKRPLSQKEWRLMRMHPTIGANLIGSIDSVAHIAPVVYAHQEKYDGSGYPEGLRGMEIPLEARILAVADAYDAMTSPRVYRQAFSHEQAVGELQQLSGRQFDPEIVPVFLKLMASQCQKQKILRPLRDEGLLRGTTLLARTGQLPGGAAPGRANGRSVTR